MGKAAIVAFEDLDRHLSGDMHACILVKDKDKLVYHRNNIRNDGLYHSFNPGPHIEVVLLQKLNSAFNGYDNIPNNSTIIFAANWSPCRQCIARSIPTFMITAKLFSRNIRIKFRFKKYYSSEDWKVKLKYPELLWKTNHEAQTAYDELSRNYRSSFRDIDANFENGTFRQKELRALVFAPISRNGTGIMHTETF